MELQRQQLLSERQQFQRDQLKAAELRALQSPTTLQPQTPLIFPPQKITPATIATPTSLRPPPIVASKAVPNVDTAPTEGNIPNIDEKELPNNTQSKEELPAVDSFNMINDKEDQQVEDMQTDQEVTTADSELVMDLQDNGPPESSPPDDVPSLDLPPELGESLPPDMNQVIPPQPTTTTDADIVSDNPLQDTTTTATALPPLPTEELPDTEELSDGVTTSSTAQQLPFELPLEEEVHPPITTVPPLSTEETEPVIDELMPPMNLPDPSSGNEENILQIMTENDSSSNSTEQQQQMN